MAPTQFHHMLDSGAATLTGALIKETTSGRILAHVQETGLLQNMLSNVNIGSFSPLGMAQLGMDTYNTQQIKRLMSMTQTLTNLSIAGLGVGLVGVGISVAGTAMTLKRLEAVKSQVSSLEIKLAQKFVDLEWREYDRMFASAKNALEHGDVLALQKNSSPAQWIDLAKELGEVTNQAQIVTQRQIQEDSFHIDLFEKIVLMQLLCRSAAIHCLMKANEVSAALQRAKVINTEHRAFFDKIDPSSLINFQLRKSGINQSRSLHLDITRKTMALISNVRQQMNAAEGQALLLQNLAFRKVDGSEYLARLDAEKKEPLLMINMAA
ncbi:hypothetical protein [Thauera butanivorans]|uniref:hypothetical protein n=1 Tax=Thauera butanivorans TaxID=86174 RepID=UPI0012F963B9|nr:hypothetical protein [Thauera butanivorans]